MPTVFLFALLLSTMNCADASSSKVASPPPTKIFLTKIDATESTGMCFKLNGNKLDLSDISGVSATSFPIDPKSLTIDPKVSVDSKTVNKQRKYLSATQVWTLSDYTGEGVVVTNDCLRTLIVLSQIDRSVTVECGKTRYRIPGHSLFLLNSPPITAVLDLGDNWTAFTGSYTQKMTPINSPTIVKLSRNAEGIDTGLPEIDEGTIIEGPLDLGGS